MEEKTITTIVWDGISIEISYEADWLGMRAKHGDRFHGSAHLELRTQNKEILPVTDTGYRSHFLPIGRVEEEGGPEAYVRKWLDMEAKSTSWKRQRVTGQQLSLF